MRKLFFFFILLVLILNTTACIPNHKVFIKGNNNYQNNKISKEEIKKLEDFYENVKYIKKCDIRVVGKIIYVKIQFTDDTELKRAKLRCSGGLGSEYDDYDTLYEIYNNNFHIFGKYEKEYMSITWTDK